MNLISKMGLLLVGNTNADRVVPPSGYATRLTVFTSGAMAFLTVFAFALSLATSRLADRWSSELAQTATVRISAPAGQMAEQTDAALTVLLATPGVLSARALSEEEERALLAPWFGADLPVDSLPIPQLIEITEDVDGVDVQGLRLRLRAEVPGAVFDDHTAWRKPLIAAADSLGDELFVDSAGFDTPSRLLYGTAGRDDISANFTPIKYAPSFFDAEDIEVAQHFATSDDGTSIPYFVVGHRHRRAAGPTLLGGYGGFEVARTPGYDGVLGRLWLSRGGTYVLANIRGGGEYGPTWHTQAMREGRHLVAEDFASVARDLVARGVTTVEQLGAQGGSNGGLLMGIMLTRYPELFGALVCSVPLLDMRRFHLLLAGASWVAEYGDPDDPDDWTFISKYSPYQNISTDHRYPPVLITTSTRDDRVHPGHARKMTAALEEAGQPVRYYENIEGGHAGAADNAQTAFRAALVYEFLLRTLQRSGRCP